MKKVLYTGLSLLIGLNLFAQSEIEYEDLGTITNAQLGFKSVPVGDLNGDGFNDIAVSEPNVDKVHIYYGKLTGFDYHDYIHVSTSNWFGWDIKAGDFNNDDEIDLAISSTGTGLNSGTVYVFYGSSGGFTSSSNPDWTCTTSICDQNFGYSLAVGDFDADGEDDLAIGARTHLDAGQSCSYVSGVTKTGVYVFRGDDHSGGGLQHNGSNSATQTDAEWIVEEDGTTSGSTMGFGWSVAFGNLNGSGGDELIVGDPFFEISSTPVGQVTIFERESATGNIVEVTTIDGNTNSRFGHSVTSGADLDGDGLDDLLIGAPKYEDATNPYGKVFLFYGTTKTIMQSWDDYGDDDWEGRLTGSLKYNSMFGFSSTFLADYNGDGHMDFAVGARDYDQNKGMVRIYYGESDQAANYFDFDDISQSQTGTRFSYSLGEHRVIDQGRSRLLVSAPMFDNTSSDQGKVYTYVNRSEYKLFQRKYCNCFDGTASVWKPENSYTPSDIIVGHDVNNEEKVAWVGSRVWEHVTNQTSGDAYPHAFFALMDPDGKNATHLLFKATDTDDDPSTPSGIDLTDTELENDFLPTWGKSINRTSDGGYIVLGQIKVIEMNGVNYDYTHTDLLLIKLNSNKQIVWSKRIGNENASQDNIFEYPGEAIEVRDHNGDLDGYMAVGSVKDFNIPSGYQKTKIFIAKVDMSGDFEWAETLHDGNPAVSWSQDHAQAIIQTGSSLGYKIYIAGVNHTFTNPISPVPPSGTPNKAFLMRYNVALSGSTPIGFDKFEVHEGSNVKALFYNDSSDPAKRKIFLGMSGLGLPGTIGDINLAAANIDCSVDNTRKFRLKAGMHLTALLPDNNWNLINLVGYKESSTNPGHFNYAAIQFDPWTHTSGDVVWAKQYPDGGDQFLNGAASLPNGNMALIGYTDNGINTCSTPDNTSSQYGLYTTVNFSNGESGGCEIDFTVPLGIYYNDEAVGDRPVTYEDALTTYSISPTIQVITPTQSVQYACGVINPSLEDADVITSIKPIADSEFTVYPNPFRDNLKIEVDNETTITIYDLNGRVVYNSMNVSQGVLSIETNTWNAGIYTIEVTNSDGRQFAKVLKQ